MRCETWALTRRGRLDGLSPMGVVLTLPSAAGVPDVAVGVSLRMRIPTRGHGRGHQLGEQLPGELIVSGCVTSVAPAEEGELRVDVELMALPRWLFEALYAVLSGQNRRPGPRASRPRRGLPAGAESVAA